MGVPRQHGSGLAAAKFIERGGDARAAHRQFSDDIEQIQPQCREHLVVARPAEMDAAGARADALGQAFLERRLPILIGKLDAPQTAFVLLRQSGKSGAQRCQIRGHQQFCGVKHFRVGERRRHVIANEPRVERVILACRVTQHALVESGVLIPQKTHASLAMRSP